MTRYNVTLTNEQNKYPVNEQELEKISCKMLKNIAEKPKITELSKLSQYNLNKTTLCMDILICNNEKIRELNKAYRKLDKATDVLSFALFADNPEERIIVNNEIFLGEVIISADTAAKQAEENNKSFLEEIYFLLGHGILHLFGFDHEDEESFDYMLKIQDELLKCLI